MMQYIVCMIIYLFLQGVACLWNRSHILWFMEYIPLWSADTPNFYWNFLLAYSICSYEFVPGYNNPKDLNLNEGNFTYQPQFDLLLHQRISSELFNWVDSFLRLVLYIGHLVMNIQMEFCSPQHGVVWWCCLELDICTRQIFLLDSDTIW